MVVGFMMKMKISNKKNLVSNALFILYMSVIIFLLYFSAKGIITGASPEIFNHKMYYVESGSMSPTINVGSLIVVEGMRGDNINVQDIITFKTDDGTVVTHRLVAINNDGKDYVTRGDANSTDDPMPIGKENIIGKVKFTVPFVGGLFQSLRTKQGIIAIGIVILVIVLIKIIFKRLIGGNINEKTYNNG